MRKRFKHLNLSPHWQQYFSKYPQGYSIIENLIDWVSQVDDMVDNQNDMNETVETYGDRLDEFIGKFDTELQGTVSSTLEDWQDSGFLNMIINDTLDTKYHEMDNRLTSQLTHVDNIKVGGGVKMEPEDASQRMLDLLNGGTVEINSTPQDKSVTPIKTTFIKKSTNLFNRGRLVRGYALGQSDGNPTPNTNWSYTDHYEPIDRNTPYIVRMVSTMSNGTYGRVFIYNSAHQLVAQSPLSTESNGVAETVIEGGDDYYYIRVSVYNDESIFDSLQINKGTDLLNYEPYYQEFDNNTTFPWMTTENEEWRI